ncbi:MAG: PqqD family protein [Acidimicrobiia bacterium]
MSGSGRSPSPSVRWVRNPELITRRGAFGVLVLAPHGDQPILLEGTGVNVWDALSEPKTEVELAGELARTFDVDVATVRADLRVALDRLETTSVVVPTGP